ncbi:hypothetical protein MMPV_003138 [Pyropia vietnamensis]
MLMTAPLLFRATIVSATPGMTSRSLPPVHTYQLTVSPSTLYRGWLPPPSGPPPLPAGAATAAAVRDPLTLYFSARQSAPPALPAVGDSVLIAARPLPSPAAATADGDGDAGARQPPSGTGLAVVPATTESLAAVAATAAIPYGWAPEAGVAGLSLSALADPSLRLVCPFPAAAPYVPPLPSPPRSEDGGDTPPLRECVRTGRPAVVGALVAHDDGSDGAPTAPPGALRLDVTPSMPAEVHAYRNPDGDGTFALTLTNTSAVALTVPAVPVAVTPHRLRRTSRVVLWSSAAVMVAESAAYALPPPAGGAEAAAIAALAAMDPSNSTSGDVHVEALVLAPGEAVTGSVNVLAAGGVAWPGGGWRIPFVVGVGGATGGAGLYYLDSWHAPLRARVPATAPAYAY